MENNMEQPKDKTRKALTVGGRIAVAIVGGLLGWMLGLSALVLILR